MRTQRDGYETPPPRQSKRIEKVSPSTFFSSPVIDLTKHNNIIETSAAVALEMDYSLHSEERSIQSCKVVARQMKRTNLEMIDILSTSEEEETIATTSKAAKKRRLVTSTSTEKPNIIQDSNLRSDTPSIKQLTRNYHHARTNQPCASAMGPQDDCEDDSEWLHTRSESLINEFDDVSEKEKKFMNLWNRFIKCHHVIADRHIPLKVENFVLRNRYELKGHDLRMNLLLHLSNLWDFGLVSKHKLLSCMAIYDDVELSCSH